MAQDPHIGELDIWGTYISLMRVGFPKGSYLHMCSKHPRVSYRNFCRTYFHGVEIETQSGEVNG
jgi:hypothetical protein